MPILNIGFLAHVDAGKTSLTERVLFETGTIGAIGAVDAGTTQTDTLELERQRGITIQSAVVSFQLGDLKVNLIDTPGHADFIAEVDRALSALDAVVIVISAVEGVQPQTRKLVRAVRGMNLPMLIFVNKIDRVGARSTELIADIERKLGVTAFPLAEPSGLGTRETHVSERDLQDPAIAAALSDVIGGGSDEFLRIWLRTDGHPSPRALRNALRAHIRRGAIVPVYFGSAITGAGVSGLLKGIRHLLPRAADCADDPVSGDVFKIQRSTTGEKLVYFRLRGGHLRLRQRLTTTDWDARLTGIDQFEHGESHAVTSVQPGEIVRLHGLREARIGDVIGDRARRDLPFAPPSLESEVRPVDAKDTVALYTALQQLAEQDPLIEVRRNERNAAISVRLYGEVQKEVITSMLAHDYGVDALFADSQIVCIERPIGSGFAEETIGETSPYAAGLALRIEPGEAGSGVRFRRPSGALPLAFYVAIEETVYTTLREGLRGWQVDDVRVIVTSTAYWSPSTVAGDFRKLTPLVVMNALREAGTRVHEPVLHFELELPTVGVGNVLPVLVAHRAIPRQTVDRGEECLITGTVPAATVHAVEQRIPGLTGGDGIMVTTFSGYEPVTGEPPSRVRTDFNPLNRKMYLALASQG